MNTSTLAKWRVAGSTATASIKFASIEFASTNFTGINFAGINLPSINLTSINLPSAGTACGIGSCLCSLLSIRRPHLSSLAQ